MLRSDGLLLALLVVRKHADSRAGVREVVRGLGRSEAASASAVGQALIRKKLLTPQEFLVLQTLVEGARQPCRCGRGLILLPGRRAARRRCRCGAVHTVASVPGLLGSARHPEVRGAPPKVGAGSGGSRRVTRRRGPSERATQQAAPEDSARGKRIGRYALLARVGDGGMGTIWKALEPGTGRTVALKLLRPDASEDTKVRFQREAEALARLDHPAVVRVHDVAADERGRRFFTMEFVEGRELRELMPTLPRRRLLELIAGVAEGLHHAHEQGIVHRDIKPHNIIVTGDGQPKIADFGLSRDLERTSLTEVGDLVGTPLYMSPEQLRGDPAAIDRRTDVYALGVVLFEGLTGRLPIEAKSLFDLQQKMSRAVAERPSKVRPDVPRELDRIVLRALEKRAEDRYTDTLQLARDLRAFLGEEAAHPRRALDASGVGEPPSPARRPGGRALLLLAGVLVAVGAGVVGVLRWREAQARAEEAARELAGRKEAVRGLLASMEQALREARAAGSRQDSQAAAAAARAGLDAAEQLRRQLGQLGADAPAGVASGAPAARAGLMRAAADALAGLGPDEREQARQLYRELSSAPAQSDPAGPDPQLLGALGRLELLDEHLPAALRHLNAALARDRERADDYWRRAEVYRGMGRPDYALLDYQAALERGGALREVKPAWVHAGRGRALLLQGKLEQAAEAISEALRLDELDVEARTAEASLLLARDAPEEALARLATLVTAFPQDGRVRRARAVAWLAAGDPGEALADLDAAIAAGASPSAWLARARLHAVLGEDGQAMADLEGALRRAHPDDPVRQMTRLVQARHLRAQGRLQDALAALSETLPAAVARDERPPRELLPHLMERVELRLLAGQASDLSAAEADLEALLAVAPGERRVYHARAELRLRRGEAARAQAELARLPEREPDPRGLTLLARAELAQRGAAGADEALRAALGAQEALLQVDPGFGLFPGDPLGEALLLLERARRGVELAARLPARRAGALEPVREDLERAARLAPWLVSARVALCRAALLAENAARALEEAERALRETLPAPALLAVHAEALGLAGRLPEALGAWDEALRLEGVRTPAAARELPRRVRHERAGWLVMRARVARQANRLEEARRDLDQALAVWPDLLEALDERQALLWSAGEREAAEADRRRLELLRRDYRGAVEAALREAWRLGSAGDGPGAIAALAPAMELVAPERDAEAAAELLYARAFLRLRGPGLPAAVADLAGMLQWSRDAFLAIYDESGPLALGSQVDLLQALEQLGPRDAAAGCDPDFLGAFVAFLARELGSERRVGPGLRACERFLARHPAHFPARLLRAALVAHAGRPRRALYLLRQAAAEPGCPAFAHFLAARLLAADHDLPRALKALEQALAGGFVAWQRIESDPGLGAVREARGYGRVLALSRGAGLLARAERLESQARAHREGRVEALTEAGRAATAGLAFLQPLLREDDPRAAALAGRLYLLRARQAFRSGKEPELARDLIAALEVSPALLLEWSQVEEGARAASRLAAPLLAAVVPREGEAHPRLLPPVAAALLQCLAGAPAPLPELPRARERLRAAPLAGTALGAVCEAVLLPAAGDPEGALVAARAVAKDAPALAGLAAWLEARALAARGDAAQVVEPLRRALEGGLSGPIERDPALARLSGAAELEPLLRAAAEAAPAATWELE